MKYSRAILTEKKELWDLFTREEEYHDFGPDRYQRFPFAASQYKNILEPAVSKFLHKGGLNITYPDGKKFALCLTHDIDVLRLSRAGTIKRAFLFFSQGQIKNSLKMLLSNLVKTWDPWWTFDKIMDLEEKYGTKSSFYFMVDKKTSQGYKIESLKKVIKKISQRGWEIGLHGDAYDLKYLEKTKTAKERLEKALGKEVIGYRSHHLRFKVPDTWEVLQKAGFKYDTTLGYENTVGFRAGMCHPFWPFNLKTGKEINILEIPLAIMDCTLLKYMKLDKASAWKTAKKLIDTTAKYNGVLTILWHNNYFVGQALDFYEAILKYAQQKNAWLTSAEEIYKFWSERYPLD